MIVDSYPDFRFHAERVEKAITPHTQAADSQQPQQPNRDRDDAKPKCGRLWMWRRKHKLLHHFR